MFEEAVRLHERLEGFGGYEAVVDPVDLAGPRPAGGAGHGEREGVRVAGEKEVVESAFADA